MTDSKCSLRAAALRQLLRAASVASDRHDGYRGLAGVLLNGAVTDGGAPALVATASDRYILVQAHAAAESVLPCSVFVPIGQVKVIAGLLKRMPGTVHIAVSGDAVTVTAEDFTVSFTTFASSLPKNTADLLEQHPAAPVPAVYSPWVMKRIAKVADRMETDIVRLSVTGTKTAAIVHIGERCRALMMPIHRDDLPAVPPVYDPFATVAGGGS
jgi:hypothetical protein